LAGDDVNSLSIYVNGGHGAVSVASNIIPEVCYELHSAARRFDMKHAQAIHAHLHPIYNTLFCEVNPVPVKYFAQRLGLIKSSFVRQPLHPLSNSSKAKIDRIIDRYFR
jgi:4-hydroxy-tetrahydrodipicolinate synthase